METFQLNIRKTSALLIVLALLHFLALFAIVLLSLPIILKATAMLLLLLHAIWQGYRYWHRVEIMQIGCHQSGWFCVDARQQYDEKHRVHVLRDTVITRGLISLHLQKEDSKKRFYLWLFVWQYSEAEYRGLARLLRITYRSFNSNALA